MAIYSIDKTSEASVIAGIKAALTATGILTTTHYETNSLIVTTTLCPMVIRIDAPSARLQTFVGTGYTSGDAIDGSVTLTYPPGTVTVAEVNVIVTDKVLYIGARRDTNVVFHTLFGNVTTANKKIAVGWWSSINSTGVIYNCTDGAQCGLHTIPRTVISADGYYYEHDIISVTNGGVLIGTAIDGVKSILMPPVVTSNYQEYGDDVVISGGDTMGVTGYFGQSLLIENGKSWAPA